MNNTNSFSSKLSSQDQFGLRVVARLDEANDLISHEMQERLKLARLQALEKRRLVAIAAHETVSNGGNTAVLHIGGSDLGIWGKFAAVFPLIALVAGLLGIAYVQDDFTAQEIADVDAELLTDDLPPSAYTDPGFAQFLRTKTAE